ncbi:AraC family transcriptional regulator [Nannocystis pusilla]|uniref:AraC family transcriptional regulator n=1 Tax=Nannocystis pusilla TaxID=889268 RepID=UPI003DA5E521
MTARLTITVKALRACVLAAERRGVAPAAVLGPLGVDPALFADPDAQVAFETVLAAWNEASRLTGDPAFGLLAAETMIARGAHIIDYVAAHCATPRELFGSITRYQRLLMSHTDLRLEVAGDTAAFVHSPERAPFARPRHLAEFVVAQWVLLLRSRRAAGFPLRRVRFVHAAPPTTDAHARLFQAPLEFGAPHDGIEFDADLLDLPLERGDPTLMHMLRRYGDELLASSAGPPATLQDRLRAHLAGRLAAGAPSIDLAARALGMSTRSLQRQLRAEGTVFKDVVEAARRDLALGHLRAGRSSVSEVAFLLGFTEVSAFSRAFRRWTGESPSTWRRAHVAPADKPVAPTVKTST